ncbi:MAG TPA: putative toxin-antitoxin system toxin component, PIN family [Pirellulales bacterium]
MSPNRPFVFDTSTIVSALLFEDSTPGEALYAALAHGTILQSADTFAELNEVVRREKFDRYVSRAKREQFLVKLLQTALLIEVKEQIRVCRDPKDDKFLELVASGNADCLVTSDADLLVIKSFRGTPILTPAEFLVWITE